MNIQLICVLSHELLNFSIVDSRICPYESDMEQRLSELTHEIYIKSLDNELLLLGEFSGSFNDILKNTIFANDHDAAIIFPHTIRDSAPYWSFSEFLKGSIDPSGHSIWATIDVIINGTTNNNTNIDYAELVQYGIPKNESFEDFLKNLPFTVRIVPGTSYYWYVCIFIYPFINKTILLFNIFRCDENNAWGTGSGSVFIKQTGKSYVGAVQILTAFKNIQNTFGNLQWMMVCTTNYVLQSYICICLYL